MEPTQKTIYQKFLDAQRAMSPARKNSTNPAYRSRYADLASVLDAVTDPLNEAGLTIRHEISEDNGRYTVTAIISDDAGQSISSAITAQPASQTPQAIGSLLTYLRRYTTMAVCGIATDDDDGNQASAKIFDPPPIAKPPAQLAPQPPEQPPKYSDDIPPDIRQHFRAAGWKRGEFERMASANNRNWSKIRRDFNIGEKNENHN